jgi:hypothetical protein
VVGEAKAAAAAQAVLVHLLEEAQARARVVACLICREAMSVRLAWEAVGPIRMCEQCSTLLPCRMGCIRVGALSICVVHWALVRRRRVPTPVEWRR